MSNNKVISKNSEILFIYDAKDCNPNGDMDNENRPRMDYDTKVNLVSDVRLKRYLRDYFENVLNKEIFITEKAVDAKERAKQINNKYSNMIDIRLFGAVYAVQGGNDHLTGPVQFNWGYSLNEVELTDSNTITCSFSSNEGVGKDFRVKYSLIAFSGSINSNIANINLQKNITLSEDDIKLFDEAMINAIPLNRTRTKIGQYPRLYMRIELKNEKYFLKDLREYIKIEYLIDNYKIRCIKEIKLNFKELSNYLKDNKEKIDKIYLWKDDNLKVDEENYYDIKIEKLNFKQE